MKKFAVERRRDQIASSRRRLAGLLRSADRTDDPNDLHVIIGAAERLLAEIDDIEAWPLPSCTRNLKSRNLKSRN